VDGWRLRIGELADLAGVTTRTLRHYERVGALAAPERARNGYRTYPASALVDVLEIRHLQNAGLTLLDATAVRAAQAAGEDSSMLDRLRGVETELEWQIDRMTARRAVLQRLRDDLESGGSVLGSAEYGSFGRIERQLRSLGVSERGIDEQRRVWSALGAIRLPGDWEVAVEVGVAELQRSRASADVAEALDLIASLRGVDPVDPSVASAGDRLAAIATAMPSAHNAIALLSPEAVPVFAVIASCFTAAQIAAVLHAMQLLPGMSAGTDA
jgi:DNA-binding transcriptional MerR regulator